MFPRCEFSGHVKPNDRRYCRLTKPARLVSLETCRSCQYAGEYTGQIEPICEPPANIGRCVNLGDTLRIESCDLCGQRGNPIEIRRCAVHGECTERRYKSGSGPRACLTCDDFKPSQPKAFPPLVGPSNLTMFFYPKRATREVWERQQEVIHESISKFDGLKLCAIAYDESTDEAAVDCSLYDEVHMLPNDPKQWELPGWEWAMGRLYGQPGFTVRLHAKGSSRGVQEQHMQRWWELGYESLLNVDRVRETLQSAKVCGPFRVNSPSANLHVPWHFSGSLYAFRNDLVFGDEWLPTAEVADDHYVEAWPALIAKPDEAACIAYDGVGDLYQPRGWRPVPEAAQQINSETPPPMQSQSASFRITDPPRVAIVIAGRNNSQYLAEAIESSLKQSVPCEIVYADDCSTDDSVSLAMGYLSQGLRVLPSGVHRGVCDARNRGANATTAENLIFLDADDYLPSSYAADCLSVMTPDVPFAYANCQEFDKGGNLYKPTPWAEYELWTANQVHTSAMWSRWAFDAAGQWQADCPTMWDYDLALRCARFGTPVPSPGFIMYRIHGASISDQLRERDFQESIPYRELIRRKNARLGIGSLISGRLPKLFTRWMDALGCAVRWWPIPSGKPRLQLWLHTDAQPLAAEYRAIAERYADSFGGIEFRNVDHHVSKEPGRERRNAIAILNAKVSAGMQSASQADVFWIVEDDIIVPVRSCKYLFDTLTAGGVPPMAVSGVYRNRHVPTKVLGGWIRDGKHFEPDDHGAGLKPVDFTGTGCLMYWTNRPGTPRAWRSHCSIEPQAAHDFAWGEDCKGVILMHGGVRCGHAKTETEIIQS